MSKQELEELLNGSLDLAEKMLSDYGEFYPYATALTKSGKIEDLGIWKGKEYPKSKDVISDLEEYLQKGVGEGRYKATALILNVSMKKDQGAEKQDSILLRMEHESGLALDIFKPYQLLALGKVQYGDIVASEGNKQFFA